MSSRGDKVRGARKRRREKALAEAEKVLRVAAAAVGKPRIIYRLHSANGIAIGAFVRIGEDSEMRWSRHAGFRVERFPSGVIPF